MQEHQNGSSEKHKQCRVIGSAVEKIWQSFEPAKENS